MWFGCQLFVDEWVCVQTHELKGVKCECAGTAYTGRSTSVPSISYKRQTVRAGRDQSPSLRSLRATINTMLAEQGYGGGTECTSLRSA